MQERNLGEAKGMCPSLLCPPQSSDPSPDKGLGSLPILCREEARLSKAAMHPRGQERALQPQATATNLQLVVPAWQAARGREPGGEASLFLRWAGYQDLSDGAGCPRTSLSTWDGQ